LAQARSSDSLAIALLKEESPEKETNMIKPRIVVTGATGKTGSVVVTELLKAGFPVRALVHREDGRSARLKAQGAEIAVVDMSDAERVADALKDVQRAYYCPPIDPYMIQGAAAFAVAAKEAQQLDQVVGLTQWLASPSHPSLMTRQHWLVDHDPPALARRSIVLDDPSSRAHDHQPRLLR
jgi:NAD(P)H dehydrogenase (quinone)